MKVHKDIRRFCFMLTVCLFSFSSFSVCKKAFCEENKDDKSQIIKEKKSESSEIDKKVVANKNSVDEKKSDSFSPTGVIKRYEVEVKEVVNRYVNKSGPEIAKKKDSEILQKVRMFFDIPKLAKLSLGEHWNKITSRDRNEYMRLFKKLLERSYVSQADQLIGNYEVVYEGEEVKGAEATVKSRVIKDDADVDIKYEMHKESSGWMIYNVIADSTNLVKLYQTSYNKIIGKYGFKDLLKRMQSKLVENGSNS